MDEASELLKKVRTLEIKTKGLSRHIFAGEYHSAFKGKGMAFSEVREYQFGDDIRAIDWNVTARFNHPYVKIFEEERELTVMLLVDISSSRFFGTNEKLKKNLITEIAAVLSFSAIHNNDKVGVILFTDKIEKFIPPKKGSMHILRIIRELIHFTPENTETNITEAVRYFTNAIKKRCIAFVISDFVDSIYSPNEKPFIDAFNIAKNKHDIIALKVYDQRETEIIPMGLLKIKDAETGKSMWLDTSDKQIRNQYKNWWITHKNQLVETFKRRGIDFAEIRTDEDYVKPLVQLFKQR